MFESVQPKKYELTFGMLFDSYKEIFVFYKDYSKEERFPVKVQTSKKGSNDYQGDKSSLV